MESIRFIRFSKNKVIIPIIWIIFFISCFRVLTKFPGDIFEILFLIVVGIVCTISIRDTILKWIKGKANYFQFILIPLFILPFITAWQAYQEFGQPFWMGLLTQRQHFIMFAGYFIFISLKKNWISINHLEEYFIKSLYIILGIMLFFSLFIDPNVFNETSFVEFTLNKGWQYEFPSDVVATILLYSILKILQKNQFKYLTILIIGILYFLIYIQDRSQILMITVTIGIYFIRNVTFNKKIIYATYGTIFIGFTVLVLTMLKPDLINHYVTLFSNASTIATGERTAEYSTNVRLKESAIALKGFDKHPWFGNGFLSSQFNNGFSGIYGYFYASDIGLLGNLFVYGIIGTLIFYVPFFLTFSWRNKLRKQNDLLLTTSQYGLFFIFLDMLTAASNIKYLGLPSIFFAIIYYYRYYVIKENKNEEFQPKLK